MRKYKTIREAAVAWTDSFNAIPRGLIEQSMSVDLFSWTELTEAENEESVEVSDILPMWSTMWSFGNSLDAWWLTRQDGIRIMSRCGFRIYAHEEFGYFFGIDGAGYDFYEQHWIPLYKARGLKWHESEE